MLTQVRFQNIRALANFRLNLQPLTVLVGPNACGKSTVLHEIERLCRFTHRNPHPTFVGGPNRIDIPPITSGRIGAQSWEGKMSSQSVSISIPPTPPDQMKIDIQLDNNGKKEEILFQDGSYNGNEESVLRVLYDFSWRVQQLILERRMILRPSPVNASMTRLESSGFGLATLLLHLASNHTEAYLKLQKDLAAVVPGFQRLYVKQIGKSGHTYYGLELVFNGAGQISAEYASEGTLFALGLLAALHSPEMPTIVLLDDLDRGLHLSAQYELVEAIRRVQAQRPELQVIATSHSPVLVDSFRAEEVRVMSLDENGHAQARPLTEMPDFPKWSRALQPGEMWANFGEKWVTEDAR